MNQPATRKAPHLRSMLASPYLLLVGAALFWSGNFVIGRAIRGEILPVSLTFLRWMTACTILLPFTYRELYRQRHTVMQHWRLFTLLGATGVAGFQLFAYFGLSLTTALNGLLFASTTPVIMAIVVWLVTREGIRLTQALGIFVSLIGVIVVIAQGELGVLLEFRINPGDLLMLGGGTVWAVYSVFLKRTPKDLSPVATLAAIVLFGLAILLPLYTLRLLQGERVPLNLPNALVILYVGLFASVIAFIFWNKGVAALGANTASMFVHLMPVFGAILSIIFLGERLAGYHLVGAALVFTGIGVSSLRRKVV